MAEIPRQPEDEPKKDWSLAEEILREREQKKTKDKDVSEKILSGDKIEGLSESSQEKLRKSLLGDKLLIEQRMAELRRIREKMKKGEQLTQEELDLAKNPNKPLL